MKTKLDALIVFDNCLLSEAMSVIDKAGQGIAFVCSDGILKATLTDGDIRRHILKNGSLSVPVSEVGNYNFKFIMEDSDENPLSMLATYRISALPVINFDGRLIKVHFREGCVTSSSLIRLSVVIMAGGKGTRLKPYTDVLPKPLIPVADKTITEHIIERFQASGCNDFLMIVNHKRELIKAYFSDITKDYQLSFIVEEMPLGTGGGIKLLNNILTDTFILTNCDILIDCDYDKVLKYHKDNSNIITMICAAKSIVIPYGTVKVDSAGMVAELTEKPEFSFLTNTGVYLIEPDFLDYIEENEKVDITDVIKRCMRDSKNIGAFPISASAWSDMGQIEEFNKMNERLNNNK